MDSVAAFAVALLVGLWAGGSFARFKRSRADVRGARTLLQAAKKRRINAGFHSVRAALVLGAVVFLFVLGLRASGKV